MRHFAPPGVGSGSVIALLANAHELVRDPRADADALAAGRPRSRPTASDRAGSPCDAARSGGPFVFEVLPMAPTRLTPVVRHGRIGTGDRKEKRLWPG